MKKTFILTIIALLITKISFAQNNQVDSLSFSTEKGLLIFEGFLNGVKTGFAFDTGAAMGVLNSKNISEAKIDTKGSIKINDSQKNLAKISKAKIDNLRIGNQNFNNITSVFTDMAPLFCNKTYLLGGDVINQLNWKFDFQKNMAYFSKTPFAPQNSMTEMPITIKGNRHFSSLVIAGTVITNLLVDFGYTGNYTMDADLKTTQQLIAKQQPSNLYNNKSFSMGVNSISVGKETQNFYVDSVVFGGLNFNNFKVSAMPSTDNKIGLFFLKKNFSQIILNNTELKYWLLPNQITPQKTLSLDAGFYFNDNGKIQVVSLNGANNSSAKLLTIGEEIKAINGKPAANFADRCEFMAWYFEQSKLEELQVETLTGEIIIIKKSVF